MRYSLGLLALLVGVVPSTVLADVTFDAAVASPFVTGSSRSVSLTTAGAHTAVACVIRNNSNTDRLSSVTLDGMTMARGVKGHETNSQGATNFAYVYTAYLNSVAPGSHTITAVFSASETSAVFCASYTGTAGIDATSYSEGLSIEVPTSQDGDMAFSEHRDYIGGEECGTAAIARTVRVDGGIVCDTGIPQMGPGRATINWKPKVDQFGNVVGSYGAAFSLSPYVPPPDETVLVTSAYAQGSFGAFFVTDVQVVNPTAGTITVTPVFQNQAAGGTTLSGQAFQLPPGGTRAIANALSSLFGVEPPAFGPIRFLGSPAIVATANVYTSNECGTVGISYQGLRTSQAKASGLLPLMASDPNHRTNLIAYNPGFVTADILLDYGSGITQSVRLTPGGWTQLNNLGKDRGVTSASYYLVFSSSQPVLMLGTVLDNTSNQSIASSPVSY